MLRIYQDVVAMQADVRDLVRQIGRHDRELASQLRRAAQAVALGVAEGSGTSAGNRRLAYERALKEARECAAAIEVAREWHSIERVSGVALDRMDKIRATLYRLTAAR